MGPKRNIVDFFKPAPKEPPPAAAPVVERPASQTDTITLRAWPSPRTSSRPASASPTRLHQPSPTPAQIPRKRPSTEPEPVVRANASLPPSNSQSSGNSTASKRRLIDGQEAVVNSDSDSDDSLNDELPVLDFGLAPPPKKTSNSLSVNDATGKVRATRSASKPNKLRKSQDSKFKSSGPSLSHLVAAAQKDAQREKAIAEGRAAMEKSWDMGPDEHLMVDDQTLAAALDSDEDEEKTRRLRLAMQRTSTTHSNAVFHFFCPERVSIRHSRFPAECLPRHGWAGIFDKKRTRDQAFASGHAQRIFQYQDLPEELASWIIDELAQEPEPLLGLKYLQLLNNPKTFKTSITPSRLNELFSSLGADVDCLTSSQPIVPSHEAPTAIKQTLPRSLRWIVSLLKQHGQSLSAESRRHALSLLIFSAFDDSVLAERPILQEVQHAIEHLICGLPDKDLQSTLGQISQLLVTSVAHPVLQNNLVQALPANTPLTATFRRHLSMSFLLHPNSLDVPLSSLDLMSRVITHLLRSPDFAITQETNYTSLGARYSLLDIAVGPGLGPVPPVPAPSQLLTPSNSAHSTPAPASTEEAVFNKQVDELILSIKLLATNIIEAGAVSDFAIMEAKDASERLCHRLENTVRTRKKRSAGVFGGDEEEEGSKKTMGGWLKRPPNSKTTDDAEGSANGYDAVHGANDLSSGGDGMSSHI